MKTLLNINFHIILHSVRQSCAVLPFGIYLFSSCVNCASFNYYSVDSTLYVIIYFYNSHVLLITNLLCRNLKN